MKKYKLDYCDFSVHFLSSYSESEISKLRSEQFLTPNEIHHFLSEGQKINLQIKKTYKKFKILEAISYLTSIPTVAFFSYLFMSTGAALLSTSLFTILISLIALFLVKTQDKPVNKIMIEIIPKIQTQILMQNFMNKSENTRIFSKISNYLAFNDEGDFKVELFNLIDNLKKNQLSSQNIEFFHTIYENVHEMKLEQDEKDSIKFKKKFVEDLKYNHKDESFNFLQKEINS